MRQDYRNGSMSEVRESFEVLVRSRSAGAGVLSTDWSPFVSGSGLSGC
jgi:hypothetical protein